jgi:hypothetical protein
MATTGKNQKKSAFLRDLLRSNPNVSEKDAVAAWQRAGNEGTISPSTFYSAKRESAGGSGAPAPAAEKTKPQSSSKGPKGKRKSEPVQPSSLESNGQSPSLETNGQSPAPEPTKVGGGDEAQDRSRRLDAVEGGIDDLIFTLKEMGGVPEVEEALRAARRLLYRS